MIHYRGKMVSFAQFGEDVMLRRFFGAQPTGFFIDVGAYDPIVDSVTQHFSLCGWSGINIEPLPELHRKFVSARPHPGRLNRQPYKTCHTRDLERLQRKGFLRP